MFNPYNVLSQTIVVLSVVGAAEGDVVGTHVSTVSGNLSLGIAQDLG